MDRFRLLFVAVWVALLGAPASAKPLTMWADFESRRAILIAEVEVLSITPGRQWGRGWNDYDIRVRVTSRPDRIYRGFAQLGQEIQLTATSGGWRSCATQLGEWRKFRKNPLVIVDYRRQVRMAGTRTSTGYRLQGFYDFNACWVRCQDATFGTVNAGRTRVDVPDRNLGKVFRKEREAFWSRVARFVAKEKPALSDTELSAHVKDLQAEDGVRRVAAHHALVAKGAMSVAAIRRQRKEQRDPEALRRIDGTLRALRAYDVAWNVSQRVPAKWHAWVLREGIKTLSGEPLRNARAALKPR